MGTSSYSTAAAFWNVSTRPRGRWRIGRTVARSAQTSVILRPVIHIVRSSQCVPMSETARSSPPSFGSSRQFLEGGVSALETERSANLFAAHARTAEHAAHRDANASQGFEMRTAHESQANYRGRLLHG